MNEADPQGLCQRLARAREQHMAGCLAQAGALYREILQIQPEHPDALHLAGVLELQYKRFDRAVQLISQAIGVDPRQPKYHSNLANCYRELGRTEDAIAAYRRAIALDPSFADAHHNLGTTLLDAGDTPAARASFERALEIEPDNALSLGGLAWLLQGLGELERAASLGRRAVALGPGRPELETNLAIILLKQGEAQAALEICEACLAAGRQVGRPLAIKAIALAEAGRGDEARQLMDLEGLITADMAAPPAPYGSLADFNRDLVAHVAGHPTLMPSPPSHATRGGLHTGELARDEAPVIRAMKAMLVERVNRVIAAAPPDSPHPFWRETPQRVRLALWGVAMQSQGHQVAHIHPSAWLSGVYYPQLPAEMKAAAAGPQGEIEFGRADDACYRRSAPMTRCLKPVEGLLVTFSGYYWHRTIPFESDQRRFSVAFDVLPEAGGNSGQAGETGA